VLIPENFIPNLNTRLYFYRKLAYLNSAGELKDVRNEMTERFGDIPNEVNHLFKITELRILCKKVSIEKFDLGVRGLTIKFRNNHFNKTKELVNLIGLKKYDLRLRSDQTLVYSFNKTGEKQRISRAFSFAKELSIL
jgi:transcription-repair coupling factor (superfamily II helicase)